MGREFRTRKTAAVRPFEYCPACGVEVRPPTEERGTQCSRCGRFWYRNPAPTVGAVIVRDGAALVSQRAFEPARGKFDVPGGFLHVGEHPIEGLKREVREELGIEIEAGVDDVLSFSPHVYGDDGDWNLSLGFAARLVDGDPCPADDVAAIRWVRLEDLDTIEWAWPHDRDMVRRALEREGTHGSD